MTAYETQVVELSAGCSRFVTPLSLWRTGMTSSSWTDVPLERLQQRNDISLTDA